MRAGDAVQSFSRVIPDGFIPGFKGSMENKLKEADDANPERSAQSLALGLLRSMTVKPGNVLHYVLSLLERL